MERAQVEPRTTQPARNTSDSSDPSVPVTVPALFGGGLVAGAVGYTAYRFRQHRSEQPPPDPGWGKRPGAGRDRRHPAAARRPALAD
jgi:hypothetical protein